MKRLDQALVARQLVSSRSAAVRHIQAGDVSVNDKLVTKPATKVNAADTIRLAVSGPQYASRAGHKLAGALQEFPVKVSGARCLDAGASTGGFTDVLLQHGAKEVIAVDVGHDQLVPQIRTDPRVEVHEGLNVRYLTLEDLGGESVDIVVADLSFISLTLVLQALAGVCAPGAQLLVMIKPQFEIGRQNLPKTGVVVDPTQRRAAVLAVVEAAVDLGLVPRGITASPLPGQDGNKEFFFWATREHNGTYLPEPVDAAEWLDTQMVQWVDTST